MSKATTKPAAAGLQSTTVLWFSCLQPWQVHLHLIQNPLSGCQQKPLPPTRAPLAHFACAMANFLGFRVDHVVDFV